MRIVAPDYDQIELTLFGPGYGECAAVHLGANRWIVVDSCLNTSTRKPAVLEYEYFNEIGISPQEAVRLIVISHWHDDHVRGLSDVVSSCPNAFVSCSSALRETEFLSYVLNYDNIMTQATSSGVSEIKKTFQILGERRPPTFAIANRPVLSLPAEGAADSCKVITLSPSDKAFDLFLRGIAGLIPSLGQTKGRASSLSPNHAAVALWIESSSVKILLGSDLEEQGDPLTGWSAIVHSAERPQGRSAIYKVAHHGSVTGHHDTVWSDMIVQFPIAVLSPFYHAGKKLPTDKDVTRIVTLAPESYITSQRPVPRSKISRSAPVERTIRETVGKIRAVQPPMGWVTLRNGGKANPNRWEVALSPAASQLTILSKEKEFRQ